MNNIQAHLKKIRSDAAECLMLSSLATDGKGEVFLRIGEHLNGLALELERSTRGEIDTDGASQHEDIAAVNVPSANPKPAARTGRLITWLLIVAFGVISGVAIWANDPANKFRSFMLSKRDPTLQDNSDRAAVRLLLSDEQAGRKLLSDQVNALAGRLDEIAGSLDNLKKGRAEITEPLSTGSAGAEAKSTTTENTPAPVIEKPVATADNRASTAESSASLNQPDTVGPRGCTLFRSFDARSGTYVTLDGRRRQCR